MAENKNSVVVRKIVPGSVAARAGLRAGDTIKSVNGNSVLDELAFSFYSAAEECIVDFVRNNHPMQCIIHRSSHEFHGIEFFSQPLKRCANRCIFCFIDQLPKGLRTTLYIKDEDYRHSFINGNYVTLATTSDEDIEAIAAIGLSPLYISVHATDRTVRNAMLCNSKGPDILGQLRKLKKLGIRFHTQIVVCPGINDGNVLKKTLKDLLLFGEYLSSIAIVPVGLTQFRKLPLRSVGPENARIVLQMADECEKNYLQNQSTRKVFCADEFFLLAGSKIPLARYYRDYPQIENGVGLLRILMDEWKTLKKNLQVPPVVRSTKRVKRICICSSVLASPFIGKIVHDMQNFFPQGTMEVICVVNQFFGNTVTVAGLLTASDIIKAVRAKKSEYDYIVVPSVMFNTQGSTLDSFTPQRLARILKTRLLVVTDLHDLMMKLNTINKR